MYEILRKECLNGTAILMEVRAAMVAKHAKAGQFVIVRPNADSERIPLTICDSNAESGSVTIVFNPIGETTGELACLEQGGYICDFCGPLGNATEYSGEKNVVVIGGGVASAIALPEAKMFKANGAKVTAIIGFKSAKEVMLENQFLDVVDKLVIVTEDGSVGEKGFVTTALQSLTESGEKFDVAFAVGSIGMMRAVANLTRDVIPTIVSMNPIMIDGTGMCGCCRLTVNGKVAFACVDGPDFDGHLVDYDSLIIRNAQYREAEKKRSEHCNLFKKEAVR